jgi:flagellar biosynthesis/type III secretory pathway M-ring protein FliF/YscJ
MFKRYKKICLVVILIVVVLVLLFITKDYLYPRKEEILEIKKEKLTGIEEAAKIEEAIKKEMEECRTNFDLERLDFTKPIWDSELPTMFKGLLVLVF